MYSADNKGKTDEGARARKQLCCMTAVVVLLAVCHGIVFMSRGHVQIAEPLNLGELLLVGCAMLSGLTSYLPYTAAYAVWAVNQAKKLGWRSRPVFWVIWAVLVLASAAAQVLGMWWIAIGGVGV